MKKPVIAIPIGDPAGVGPEIVAKSIASDEVFQIAVCVIVGDRKIVEKAIEITGENLKINEIKEPEEAVDEKGVLNLINLDNVDMDTFAYGNTQIFVGKVGDEKYSTKTPMGSLTQPSDNFEDFIFTINGFDIEQNGKTVAKATYGFYKYLHVDGNFNPNAEVKVTHNVEHGTDLFGNEIKNWESTVKGQTTTQLGDAGGVGIKYWLQSLEVLPGAQLILYGLSLIHI